MLQHLQFVQRGAALAFLFLFGACVQPCNPYDPETAPEDQAKAAVSGSIFFDRLSFVEAIMQADLEGTRIELRKRGTTDAIAAARCAPQGAIEVEMDCNAAEATGSFSFEGIVPGDYEIAVVGFPLDLDGPNNGIAAYALFAGEDRRLGRITYRELPEGDQTGRGTIAGEVQLEDEGAVVRTVTLYRRSGDGAQPVGQAPTDTAGRFAFAGLPNGTYALMAERTGYTPDFRLGVDLDDEGGTIQPVVSFDSGNGGAMLLHPVTAVLEPNLSQEDNGLFYTNGDDVSVDVLAFTDMTNLRMRISTDPTFGAGDEPQAFVPHAAEVTVPLPDVQGDVPIYVQFQTNHPDYPEFVFQTDRFSTLVVRDTEPPEVVSATITNLTAGNAGTYWLTQDGGTVAVDVLASDLSSSVANVLFENNAQNMPGDITAAADVDSPPGLVLLPVSASAVAGEGERIFYVSLRDQAGNEAEPYPITVFVDATPPVLLDPPLTITNADAESVLAGRTALISVNVADGLPVEDMVEQMRIGQDAAPLTPFGPFAPSLSLVLNGGDGQTVTIVADVRDAAGNVATVSSPGYVLDLSGQISGRALVDQEDEETPVHGGILARLYEPGAEPGDTAPLTETQTDVSGRYAFGGIPEGSGYLITFERAGLINAELSVPAFTAGQELNLPKVNLPFARGNVSGVFRLEDKADDPTAHDGITVHAVLNGDVVASAITTSDGTFSFPVPGVPVNVGTERYDIRASKTGYFSATEIGIQVFQNTTTIVREVSGEPSPVLLKPVSGDFLLCAVGADPCEATPFVNDDSVQVKLIQDDGVTQIRTQARTAFSAGDATPAFSAYDSATPAIVDISGADGVVEVFVQLTTNGIDGPVLSATILRDTIPPSISALEVSTTQAAAVGTFTNLPEARARVIADQGAGDTAPLGAAYLSSSDTAPATIPVGAVICAANSPCIVPLPGAVTDEKTHNLWGFVCDQAENCTAAPATASIVYDATAPRTLHGTAAVPTGATITDSGGVLYTTIAQYFLDLDVGAAQTDALDAVLDVNGQPVSDVAAYRLLPVFVGDGAAPTGVDLAAVSWSDVSSRAANEVISNVTAPALTGSEGLYRVFAQYRDRAGNVSSADNNPFYFDLTLDFSPPAATVAINGGAAYTRSPNVTIDVTASPVDPPVLAWVSQDGGLFETYQAETLTDPPAPIGFDLSTFSNFNGDGLYFVYVRFFDAAGNSVDRTGSITLDTQAPNTVPLQCSTCVNDAGTVLSASRNVTLEVFATDALSGVETVRTQINSDPSTDQDFLLSMPVTLPDTDGAHTITVEFIDGAGNVSAPAEQIDITLDRSPPTFNPATDFVINSGDAYATTATVNLSIVASDAATMRLSNSATFAVPFGPLTSSVLWQLSAPTVDGSKEVFIEVADAAGNVASASDTIVLDTAAPAGTVQINGNAAASASSDVTVTLSFPADTDRYALLNGAVDCGTVSISTAAPASPHDQAHTLVTGDGTKVVTACFRDNAGNVAGATDDILVDTTDPSGTIAIESGLAYATSATVDVVMSASDDVTEVAFSESDPGADCSAPGTYQSYEPLKQYVFASDGAKVLYACLRDGVGRTYRMSDAITIDTSAPSAVTLQINGGSTYTAQTDVTLTIAAPADTSELSIVNGASLDCASASYEAFSSNRTWTLTTVDGAKTVTICIRDAAGLTASDNAAITLDTSAPALSVLVASGALATTDSTPTAALTFSNDVVGYKEIPAGASCGSAGYTTVSAGTTSASFTANISTGPNTIAACVIDRAGNTNSASDDIELDTTAPTGGVSINDGAAYTDSTSVTVTFTPSSDVIEYAVSPGALNCGTASYNPYTSSTAAVTLTATDGLRTVTACYRDGAGLTTSASDTIVLDRLAPVISTFKIVASQFPDAANDSSHTRSENVLLTYSYIELNAPKLRIANGTCTNLSGAPFDAPPDSYAHQLSTGADGTQTVCIEVSDAAGHATQRTDTIVYDTTAPTLTNVEINGDAPFANGSTTVTVAANAGEEVYWKGALGFIDCDDNNGYQPALGVASPTLSDSVNITVSGLFEGLNRVRVCARDDAGNVTEGEDDIIFDDTAPFAEVELDGDPAPTYTSSDTSTVQFVNYSFDIAEMAFSYLIGSCGGLPAMAWETFDASTTVTLPAMIPSGEYMPTICLRDTAGNIGQVITPDRVLYDVTAPSSVASVAANTSPGFVSNTPGSPTIIAEGRKTNDPRPIFVWSAAAETDLGGLTNTVTYAVELATSPSFASIDLSFAPLQPSDTFARPSADLTEGTWYARVVATNAAGLSSASTDGMPSTSLSFIVDRTGPGVVSINPTAEWVGGPNQTFFPFSFYPTDPDDSATYGYRILGPSFAYPSDLTFQPTGAGGTATSATISSGNLPTTGNGDVYTLEVVARDFAGTPGQVATREFKFDDQPPCSGTITLTVAPQSQTPGYTNLATVTSAIDGCTGTGTPPTQVRVNCNGTNPTGIPASPFQPFFTCVLSPGQGMKNISVVVEDDAGNPTNVASGSIVFDSTDPAIPTLGPANSTGVNQSCAKMDAVAGSTLDTNFARYEVNIDGYWINTLLDGNDQVHFDLRQDSTNLLKIRAVDRAGNVGEPQTAILEETSTIHFPTDLQVERVCDGGRWAIAKDTASWPSALGFAGSANASAFLLPDIFLLNLEENTFKKINGPGGLAEQRWASALQGGAIPTLAHVTAAGCAIDDNRLVISYIEDPDPTDGVVSGPVRFFTWTDPTVVGGPGGVILSAPVSFQVAGSTIPLVPSSLDAIQFVGAKNFYALVNGVYSYNAGSGFRYYEHIQGYYGDSANAPGFALPTGALNQYMHRTDSFTPPTSRHYYGVAQYPDDDDATYIRWVPAASRWETKHSTNYYTSEENFSATATWSLVDGFPEEASPYGVMVKPAVYAYFSTTFELTEQFVWSSRTTPTGPFARTGRANSNFATAINLSGAAYTNPLFIQLGQLQPVAAPEQVGYLDETDDGLFQLQEAHQSDPIDVPVVNRQELRHAVDRTLPVLATGQLTPGGPLAIYHTRGLGTAKGIVILNRDEPGCFNEP